INIIPIQAKTHFQTQSIPGTQANGPDTKRRACPEDLIPNMVSMLIVKIKLEAASPGITSCRDQDIFNSRKYPFFKGIVLHRGEINISKTLQGLYRQGTLNGKQ